MNHQYQVLPYGMILPFLLCRVCATKTLTPLGLSRPKNLNPRGDVNPGFFPNISCHFHACVGTDDLFCGTFGFSQLYLPLKVDHLSIGFGKQTSPKRVRCCSYISHLSQNSMVKMVFFGSWIANSLISYFDDWEGSKYHINKQSFDTFPTPLR